MRNIPVDLSGFRLTVSEEPAIKMRKGKGGELEPVADRETGAVFYQVALFVKPRTGGKGEEIRVTLSNDPGDGFGLDARVDLVGATVSPYSFENDRGETVSGVSFKAAGLKPVG